MTYTQSLSNTPYIYRVSPPCVASGAAGRQRSDGKPCHTPYMSRVSPLCGSSGAGSRRCWNSDLCHTPYIHRVLDQCDFSHVRYSSGWTWKLCHTPCTWRAFPHCGSSDAEGTLSCIGRSSHILYICRTSCHLGVSDWDSDWKSATLPCFQNPSAETRSWEALPWACHGPLCPQRLAALPPALLSWCPSHHLTKETTSFLITELEGKQVPAVLVFSYRMWYFKNIPWDGYELPWRRMREISKNNSINWTSDDTAVQEVPLIRKGWGMNQGRWGGQMRTSRVGRKGSRRGTKNGRDKREQKEIQTGFKRQREGDPQGGKRHPWDKGEQLAARKHQQRNDGSQCPTWKPGNHPQFWILSNSQMIPL